MKEGGRLGLAQVCGGADDRVGDRHWRAMRPWSGPAAAVFTPYFRQGLRCQVPSIPSSISRGNCGAAPPVCPGRRGA